MQEVASSNLVLPTNNDIDKMHRQRMIYSLPVHFFDMNFQKLDKIFTIISIKNEQTENE